MDNNYSAPHLFITSVSLNCKENVLVSLPNLWYNGDIKVKQMKGDIKMARQAREKSKSGNYFISLRGSELYVTDADKERFTEIAADKFTGGKVYGVEIDKTEIRMVVKEPSNGISMAIKSLTTVYARYFNNANGREGKIFEGRFRSMPLETKKEVDECVANLKTAEPKKTAKPKSAPKKAAAKPAPKTVKALKKEEKTEAETVKKPEPKKSLPSWLL